MKYYSKKSTQGFTIFEIMVVISIIAMLSSVIMVGVMNARKSARDKIRIASVEQIKLGLKLEKEKNGVGGLLGEFGDSGYSNGNYENSVELGVRFGVDDSGQLGGVMPYLKPDPLNTSEPPNQNSANGYWFDSKFKCTANNQNVVYTRLESSGKGNFNTICPASGSPENPNGSSVPSAWAKADVYITVVQ